MIYREQQNNEDANVKKHVIVNFIERYDLKLRRIQQRKKKSKEAFRDSLTKCLIKTGSGENYNPVYGGYAPTQRYNVDQSPLPCAIYTKRTYKCIEPKNKENRYNIVWVSQPAP